MILVSVGTQLPFDRLVRAMDAWAADHPQQTVFAQIGASDYQPQHLQATASLSPTAFAQRLEEAQLVVAHAGMGTIIGALELAKPIIVMPRRADLGEHRNNHQLATAAKLQEAGMVRVAEDAEQLAATLDAWQDHGETDEHESQTTALAASASPQLLQAVSDFIHTGRI